MEETNADRSQCVCTMIGTQIGRIYRRDGEGNLKVCLGDLYSAGRMPVRAIMIDVYIGEVYCTSYFYF